MATIEQRLQYLAYRLQQNVEDPPVGFLDVQIAFENQARNARAITARIPDVFAALEEIKTDRITGPEKHTADLCIAKVRELLGGGE